MHSSTHESAAPKSSSCATEPALSHHRVVWSLPPPFCSTLMQQEPPPRLIAGTQQMHKLLSGGTKYIICDIVRGTRGLTPSGTSTAAAPRLSGPAPGSAVVAGSSSTAPLYLINQARPLKSMHNWINMNILCMHMLSIEHKLVHGCYRPHCIHCQLVGCAVLESYANTTRACTAHVLVCPT